MSAPSRSDVPPTSIGIDLREEGIVVEYLDGRTTLYRGAPEPIEGAMTTGPGKETHVLVTDPTETEGVMTYVNDFKTDDEILRDSGVGRVVLEPDETEELFPGVVVTRTGQRNEVVADPAVAGGRVFVFVEDEWSEGSYEIVEPPEEGLDAHR
ncbi:DUF5796 family protein [Halorubrum sp. DTA98]|uniref:DUF5796 family protein n=1 Tax=Halorubrum sp. DTA98 TaxID=3402163 RepID=UPI003AAAFB41